MCSPDLSLIQGEFLELEESLATIPTSLSITVLGYLLGYLA